MSARQIVIGFLAGAASLAYVTPANAQLSAYEQSVQPDLAALRDFPQRRLFYCMNSKAAGSSSEECQGIAADWAYAEPCRRCSEVVKRYHSLYSNRYGWAKPGFVPGFNTITVRSMIDDEIDKKDFDELYLYYISREDDSDSILQERLFLKNLAYYSAQYRIFTGGTVGGKYVSPSEGSSGLLNGTFFNRANYQLDYISPEARFDVRQDRYASSDYLLDERGNPNFNPLLAFRAKILLAQTYLRPEGFVDQDPIRAADTLRKAYSEYIEDIQMTARRIKIRALSAAEENRIVEEDRNNFAMITGIVLGLASTKLKASPSQQANFAMLPYRFVEAHNSNQRQALETLQQNWINSIQNPRTITDDGVRFPLLRVGRTAHGNATANEFPLQNVVRITALDGAGNTSLCSGTLVFGNRVLTAQHCVRSKGGQPYAIRSIEWEYQGLCESKSGWRLCDKNISFTPSGVQSATGHWAADWRNDWAIIGLKDDVEKLGFNPSRIADMSNPATAHSVHDERLVIGGYSGDLNDGREITVHWGCAGEIVDRLIQHRCRGWKGLSGSAIFIASGPLKGHIVGVNAFAALTRSSSNGQILRQAATTGGGPDSSHFYKIIHH